MRDPAKLQVPRSPTTLEATMCVIGLLACIAPVAITKFAPCTDVPQHIAQIPLLREALGGHGDLVVNWLAPGNLAYAVIALTWALLPPDQVAAGSLTVLVAAWGAATILVAWRRTGRLAGAVVAMPLLFNHALYWGFLQFVAGWPVFVLWLLATAPSAERPSMRYYVRLGFLALLLYEAHSLWFMIGLLWLGTSSVVWWRGRNDAIARAAAVAPTVLAAFAWFTEMRASRAASGFDLAPHWFIAPWARVLPSNLVDAALGGVQGAAEPLFLLFVGLWIAAVLVSCRSETWVSTDRYLVAAAALLLGMSLFAPDKYQNSIYLASRWVPVSLTLLLVALPTPRLNPLIPAAVALCCALAFSAVTLSVWRQYGERELSGLDAALASIQAGDHVLGLDFVKHSSAFKHRPFLQTFAYAQVVGGGEPSFSFAEHFSSLVRHAAPREVTWTPGLEWVPELVTTRDAQQFEIVLVNAPAQLHERVPRALNVAPLTNTGSWRAYATRRRYMLSRP
jgi:hypothetical protein